MNGTDGRCRRAVFALAVLCGAAPLAQPAPAPITNALWVYSVTSLPSPVTDPPTRTTLIQNSSASGVNMLYVSVYSSTLNAAGRYLYQESDIAALITQAHAQGMQVYTAMGDPDWPSSGCATSDTPYARFSDIAGYDSANPSAKFDGIILDVEPGSSPDYAELLSLYQCFQQLASAKGLGLAVAISAFWTDTVTFNQATEPAYAQIVDLKLNQIVVMGYRNTAGTLDCTQGDGVVCLDENVIQYANSVSLANSVLVGLNTDNPSTSGDLPEETFYSLGQVAMDSTAQSVYSQFAAANESFGGFAINNYRDSYLNGQLSGWPATNAAFLAPAISLVANAEGQGTTIAPNTWVEIKGSNLSPPGDSRIWQASDFVNGDMPVALDGVSVTINGKNAYIWYISPTQINVLTPPVSIAGSVNVVATNNGLVSGAFTAQAQSLSPSFFVFDSTHVAAVHLNGTDVGPASLYPGLSTPAMPGEPVVIFANGFGPTSMPVVSGSPIQSGSLSPLPVVKIGGTTAAVQFAGLVAPGEFQFNVVVPESTPNGDNQIVATYNGLSTQNGAVITVQN
jgi:uncharacterized protein (TIGR03437 family)